MKYIITLALFIIIGLGGIKTASAATPALSISWKANGYAPLSYGGKILPSAGTRIDIAALLVENNRAVDLSAYEIRWYANDQFIGGGLGRATANIIAPRTGEDEIRVRANIPRYQNKILDEFIAIPIAQPEAVINRAKLPLLEPLFYFFNIASPSSLTINWEDKNESVTVRASNKNNPAEFAQATITKQ